MRTPLHYASKSDHKGLVEELLNKGADINAMDNTNSTPLHDACYEGHEALSRFLANRGADIHVENEFGDTPMKIDYGRTYQLKNGKLVPNPFEKKRKLAK